MPPAALPYLHLTDSNITIHVESIAKLLKNSFRVHVFAELMPNDAACVEYCIQHILQARCTMPTRRKALSNKIDRKSYRDSSVQEALMILEANGLSLQQKKSLVDTRLADEGQSDLPMDLILEIFDYIEYDLETDLVSNLSVLFGRHKIEGTVVLLFRTLSFTLTYGSRPAFLDDTFVGLVMRQVCRLYMRELNEYNSLDDCHYVLAPLRSDDADLSRQLMPNLKSIKTNCYVSWFAGNKYLMDCVTQATVSSVNHTVPDFFQAKKPALKCLKLELYPEERFESLRKYEHFDAVDKGLSGVEHLKLISRYAMLDAYELPLNSCASSLVSLKLRSIVIKDLSSISLLTRLQSLVIHVLEAEDLSPLEKLAHTSLRQLDVWHHRKTSKEKFAQFITKNIILSQESTIEDLGMYTDTLGSVEETLPLTRRMKRLTLRFAVDSWQYKHAAKLFVKKPTECEVQCDWFFDAFN